MNVIGQFGYEICISASCPDVKGLFLCDWNKNKLSQYRHVFIDIQGGSRTN